MVLFLPKVIYCIVFTKSFVCTVQQIAFMCSYYLFKTQVIGFNGKHCQKLLRDHYMSYYMLVKFATCGPVREKAFTFSLDLLILLMLNIFFHIKNAFSY